MNAVLIIDKPAGLTSHDVVNRARRILRERSIGHLGTLDPMATGVLPLVAGNLTRLAQFYAASEKTYEGTIRFGFATDTYDAEGEPTTPTQEVRLNPEGIEALAARFRGVIQQTPPPFSAKKIKGVPAYKLARQQKEVVLQPVEVDIKEFEILAVDLDRVRFRARVASGTYMRSVAHDMGRELACGAHLESLRRTAVAEFTLADAHTLEELADAAKPGAPFLASFARSGSGDADRPVPEPAGATVQSGAPSFSRPSREGGDFDSQSGSLESFFIHPRKLLPAFPSVTADDPTVARIRSGRTINLPDFSRNPQVKVFAGQSDLIAIATRIAGTLFHPKIVLCG
jgi:tRNA pseudouridine55 synthase